MDRLVAVRAVGDGEDVVLHGFVSRGKNRKLVWTVPVKGLSKDEVRQKIQEAENARITASQG